MTLTSDTTFGNNAFNIKFYLPISRKRVYRRGTRVLKIRRSSLGTLEVPACFRLKVKDTFVQMKILWDIRNQPQAELHLCEDNESDR